MKHSIYFKSITLMSLMAVFISANAADVCIDGLYYNLVPKAKVASVTNIGNTSNSGYSGILYDVTIPSTIDVDGITYNVTSISEYAFNHCSTLQSVVIPSSVTNIGSAAFLGCTSLSAITLPNTMKEVPIALFSGCSSLEAIDIPNTITTIGNQAFQNSGLTSISVPNSVTTIGRKVFSGCTKLATVDLPSTVTSIDKNSFDGCSRLTSLQLPESLTSISEATFLNCVSLDSIEIPDNVTAVGKQAFKGCTGLTYVNIGNSAKSIEEGAFQNCCNITTLNIGNNVTNIGNTAFSGCHSIDSLTLPISLEYIGNSAFSGLDSITTLTIPQTVTYIDNFAFGDCTHLKDLTINCHTDLTADLTYVAYLPTIGYSAFNNCPSLETVAVTADGVVTNFSTTAPDAFNGSYIEYATLYIPNGSDVENSVWENFGTILISETSGIPTSWNLVDGENYTNATRFINMDISYTRTFDNTEWQTLYIPFSLDYEDWKNDFDIAHINGIRLQDIDNDGVIDYQNMDIVKITSGVLKPNMPYLIKAKTASEKYLTVSDATLYPNTINSIECSTTITKYTFTGTYTTIPSATLQKGKYWTVGNDGVLVPCTEDLKPFSWVMNIEVLDPMYYPANISASKIRICVVGEQDETGITTIYDTDNHTINSYDISGRKVSNNYKGLMIRNGKKYWNK